MIGTAMRVLGGVMLSLLLFAPGCAGGNDSLGSNERWGKEFVHEQILCDGVGELVLTFTGANVVVSRGGDDLASASVDGRRLSKSCDEIDAGEIHVRGSPPVSDPVYGNAEVACRVPRRVVFQVHPIMESNRPAGSVLLVLNPDRHRLVASAPLKDGGSRLYYDTSACSRSS
jgi:hypothetical protein